MTTGVRSRGSTQNHKAAFGAITYQVGTRNTPSPTGPRFQRFHRHAGDGFHRHGTTKHRAEADIAWHPGTDSAAFTSYLRRRRPYRFPASALFRSAKP